MSSNNGDDKKSVIRRASHSFARIFHKRQYSADFANLNSVNFTNKQKSTVNHVVNNKHRNARSCRSQSTSDLPFGKYERRASVILASDDVAVSQQAAPCACFLIERKVFPTANFAASSKINFCEESPKSIDISSSLESAVSDRSFSEKMTDSSQKISINENGVKINFPSGGGSVSAKIVRNGSRKSSSGSTTQIHQNGTDTPKVLQSSPKVAVKKSSAPPVMETESLVPVSKRKTHKERRFHRLFRNVPLDEVLLNRFSCAFVSDIGLLIQGHMYVSNDWICFHSNIFGIEKIIEISVNSIATVQKARTAKIFPNAVIIRTKSAKEYFFASLISRDTTHNVLSDVLSRYQKMESVEENSQNAKITILNGSNHPAGQDILNDSSGSGNLLVSGDNLSCSSADSSDEDDSTSANCGEEMSSSFLVSRIVSSANNNNNENIVNNRSKMAQQSQLFFTPHGTPSSTVENGAIGGPAKFLAKSKSVTLSLVKQFYCSSVLPFMNWFYSLPLLLMILVVCVFLLVLLLILAAIVTFKFVNIETYDVGSLLSLSNLNVINQHHSCQSDRNWENLREVVQKSIVTMTEVREHLETLRRDLSQEMNLYESRKLRT